MGKAFEEMKAGEYFPCMSLNHGKNAATLNSSARMPTEPYRKYGIIGGEEEQRPDESEEEGME